MGLSKNLVDVVCWRWTADAFVGGKNQRDAIKYACEYQYHTKDASLCQDRKQLRHEHMVPRAVLHQQVLQADNESDIYHLLKTLCVAAVVTKPEDKLLNGVGLRQTMPVGWSPDQARAAFARYDSVGIHLLSPDPDFDLAGQEDGEPGECDVAPALREPTPRSSECVTLGELDRLGFGAMVHIPRRGPVAQAPTELVEATRGAWVMARDRASRLTVMLGMVGPRILSALEVKDYSKTRAGRFEFDVNSSARLADLVGKRVVDHKGNEMRWSQNPVRYFGKA
jgi:hypothetical protein